MGAFVSRLLMGAAATVLSFWVGPVCAATVVTVNNGSFATAVDGLIVDGSLYDVTFSSPPGFGSDNTFLNNLTGADHAAAALSSALNASGVIGVTNIGVGAFSIDTVGGIGFHASGPVVEFFNPLWGVAVIGSGSSIAEFSPVSATPLPATLSLFATGLGVMGWLSRRRKQNGAGKVCADTRFSIPTASAVSHTTRWS